MARNASRRRERDPAGRTTAVRPCTPDRIDAGGCPASGQERARSSRSFVDLEKGADPDPPLESTARSSDAQPVAGRLQNADLARVFRRLTALGMQVAYESDGDGLEASFTPPAGALRDPLGETSIGHVRLRVSADGRVRIHAPSLLAGTPERGWQQLPTLAQLCAELQAGLDKRHAESETACAELIRLGFDAEIDPESRRPVFALEIDPGAAVVFECELDRVVARVLHAAGFAPTPIHDLSFPLRTLAPRVDFALQVASALERQRRARPAQPPQPAAHPAGEPRGIALGVLLEALGPDWLLSGATLSCATSLRGESARLVLELTESGPFTLRLLGAGGTLWTRPLERTALAQWERIAARSAPAGPTRAAPGWGEREERLARGLLPPAVGETWVMEVRVESDDGSEVRYRGVNVGGEDYGAPRVLRKDWFEETFVPSGGGWRMRVRVTEVDEASVVYQRLSPQREGVGKPRRIALVIFLASFVPEACDY